MKFKKISFILLILERTDIERIVGKLPPLRIAKKLNIMKYNNNRIIWNIIIIEYYEI